MFRHTITVGIAIDSTRGVSKIEFENFLKTTVAESFDGFTVRHVTGYWRGIPEDSAEIVILTEVDRAVTARIIAREYATRFNQECVLVQTEKVDAHFVTGAPATAAEYNNLTWPE